VIHIYIYGIECAIVALWHCACFLARILVPD